MTPAEFTKAKGLTDDFRKLLNTDTMQIALGAMREAIMQDVANFENENLKGYARYHERFISLAQAKSPDIPDDFSPGN